MTTFGEDLHNIKGLSKDQINLIMEMFDYRYLDKQKVKDAIINLIKTTERIMPIDAEKDNQLRAIQRKRRIEEPYNLIHVYLDELLKDLGLDK